MPQHYSFLSCSVKYVYYYYFYYVNLHVACAEKYIPYYSYENDGKKYFMYNLIYLFSMPISITINSNNLVPLVIFLVNIVFICAAFIQNLYNIYYIHVIELALFYAAQYYFMPSRKCLNQVMLLFYS